MSQEEPSYWSNAFKPWFGWYKETDYRSGSIKREHYMDDIDDHDFPLENSNMQYKMGSRIYKEPFGMMYPRECAKFVGKYFDCRKEYGIYSIVDEEFSDLDPEERRAAEEELEKRDAAEKTGRVREPSAFLAEEFEETMNTALLSRHRALQRNLVAGLESLNIEEDPEELALDYEDPKGKLNKWIQEPRTIRWIRRNFRSFLLDFRDEQGNDIYKQRIREMCSDNKQTLEVSYTHLVAANPTIALWVADEPQVILPFLNEIAFEIVLSQFKAYSNIFQEIFVRIRDLPIGDQLRDLRHHHLNKLIKVRGVVTRRTGVYPQLKVMVFFCSKCGEKKGPIFQNSHNQVDIGICGNCQSKGPFKLNIEETIYRNYQKITLQETPGSVPPGRVPRHKEIILLADLIDIARPGEEVEITGIYTHMFDYSLNVKHGFPIFSTVIEAGSFVLLCPLYS